MKKCVKWIKLLKIIKIDSKLHKPTNPQTHKPTNPHNPSENMFHLPDVLIDYIFSFDDNAYHKRSYRAIMKELDMWYSWRRTSIFLGGETQYIYDLL